MKKEKSRFRVHSPLHDNILSLTAILSLFVLTLAAVGGILWMMLRTGMISGDQWLFEPPTKETVVFNHDDGVFDALRPLTSEDQSSDEEAQRIIRFSGSFSTLRALLSDLDAPDCYNALFETVIHAASTDAVQQVRVYRFGDAYRINRYFGQTSSAGNPTEYYICDGAEVEYTDNRTKTHARFPVSQSFSVDALAGIPSVASFNEIADEQILHASYAEMNGEVVYYVLYTTPTTADQTVVHEVWISAAAELVQRCNTYLCSNGSDPLEIIANEKNRIFSSALISIAALSEREQRVMFVLPDSN